ncbi:cadherin-like domain-containing protein [Nocardioides sp. B-3]|uniref:cadherin-like domain-containing protein n=1 Tax=Nocardioides sp. B-3 TaxID=2895565 RepID=UPI003FA55300
MAPPAPVTRRPPTRSSRSTSPTWPTPPAPAARSSCARPACRSPTLPAPVACPSTRSSASRSSSAAAPAPSRSCRRTTRRRSAPRLRSAPPTWSCPQPLRSRPTTRPRSAPTRAASVNVIANDTDVNGDLAAGSVAIVSGPSAGTAVANPDGTVTYTNTSAALTDSFTYTVADAGGLVSNAATVNISILGDTCDASVAACSRSTG